MKIRDAHEFNQIQIGKYLNRTGILVDIQNIGKNVECIAIREKSSFKEMRSGVWLKKEPFDLPNGSFTNVYDLSWSPKEADLIPVIHSSNTPYSLSSHVAKNPNVVGIINGAFFFLTDVAEKKPIDLPYNLCIREGKVLGLPILDRPIIYIKDGKIKGRETKARGTLKIGKETIEWVGVRSKFKNKNSNCVLFNSNCSDVVRIRDVKSNIQIGILDSINIFTPKGKNVTDIIIGKDKDNNLKVVKVKKGGGTHFFDGLFILQIKKTTKKFSVGKKVTSLILDGLDLSKLTSGITVGRKINSPDFKKKSYIVTRDARSVLAEDNKGNIHFVVFDGSKYIPGFEGVTTKDTSSYLLSKEYKWAYFLDGGGSSRVIVRTEKELEFLANEFAFRKYKSGAVVWDYQGARKLASSISIQVRGQ